MRTPRAGGLLMETISNLLGEINGVVWGPLMLALILGTGLYLQAGLNFVPIRNWSTDFPCFGRAVRRPPKKARSAPSTP